MESVKANVSRVFIPAPLGEKDNELSFMCPTACRKEELLVVRSGGGSSGGGGGGSSSSSSISRYW